MKKSSTKRKRKLKFSSGAFIAPSFLGVMAFFILPFMVVIYYSMIDGPVSGNFVFLDNFAALVRHTAFKRAVQNTVTFSVTAVPLAVVLSLLLAIMLEAKMPFRSQFRTFFLSPLMVPVASIVLIWQVLFHYNGAVNEVLIFFGKSKIDWLKSDYALVVIGQYPERHPGGGQTGERQALTDVFLHQNPLSVFHHFVCDHYVPDQLV